MTAASCPAPGAPGTVFGYPACVYGFVMFLVVFAVALAGLASRDARSLKSRPSSGPYPQMPMLTPKR